MNHPNRKKKSLPKGINPGRVGRMKFATEFGLATPPDKSMVMLTLYSKGPTLLAVCPMDKSEVQRLHDYLCEMLARMPERPSINALVMLGATPDEADEYLKAERLVINMENKTKH